MIHNMHAYPTASPMWMASVGDSPCINVSWRRKIESNNLEDIIRDTGIFETSGQVEQGAHATFRTEIIQNMLNLCIQLEHEITFFGNMHKTSETLESTRNTLGRVTEMREDSVSVQTIMDAFTYAMSNIPESSPWSSTPNIGSGDGKGGIKWDYLTFWGKYSMRIGYMCLLRCMYDWSFSLK